MKHVCEIHASGTQDVSLYQAVYEVLWVSPRLSLNKLGCVRTSALVGCKIRIEIKALIRVPHGANSNQEGFFLQNFPGKLICLGSGFFGTELI